MKNLLKCKKNIAREFLILLLIVIASLLSIFVFYAISKFEDAKCKKNYSELSKYNNQLDSLEKGVVSLKYDTIGLPRLPKGVTVLPDTIIVRNSLAINRVNGKINELLNQNAEIQTNPIDLNQSAKFVFYILLGLAYPVRGLFLMTVWSVKTMRKKE
ncbi:MAG: hypothetical protein ABI199_03990 [Bacteroidia bacterium]